MLNLELNVPDEISVAEATMTLDEETGIKGSVCWN